MRTAESSRLSALAVPVRLDPGGLEELDDIMVQNDDLAATSPAADPMMAESILFTKPVHQTQAHTQASCRFLYSHDRLPSRGIPRMPDPAVLCRVRLVSLRLAGPPEIHRSRTR